MDKGLKYTKASSRWQLKLTGKPKMWRQIKRVRNVSASLNFFLNIRVFLQTFCMSCDFLFFSPKVQTFICLNMWIVTPVKFAYSHLLQCWLFWNVRTVELLEFHSKRSWITYITIDRLNSSIIYILSFFSFHVSKF